MIGSEAFYSSQKEHRFLDAAFWWLTSLGYGLWANADSGKTNAAFEIVSSRLTSLGILE